VSGRTPSARIAAATGLALAAATTVALTGCADAGSGGAVAATAPLPPPPEPFAVPTPRRLPDPAAGARYAAVLRATTARARPDAGSPAVGAVDPRTPEGTENIVLIEGRATDAGGRVWVRALLASRTAATGWIPREDLGGYTRVATHLVVDLRTRTLTLRRGGDVLLSAPVGVGTPDAPTPAGEFYVRNKLTRYRSPAYGPVAFGTSARSPTLTDWPAGGFVGIHGTDRPDLLPGRVSHGCIRMRNADILRLERLMPVGTPLTIS
jgi:lipoprotein-anchoring transpeptidase ErfK/SrfK